MILSDLMNVFIIDDDPDVLNSYKNLLGFSGFNVKGLLDPTNALKLIGKDWAGVVILDMYMPQMHGLELLRQIKEFDKTLPVIVITGHGDIPMAVKAVKLGALDFLEKPINPTDLLSLITSHLSQREAFINLKKLRDKSISKELIGRTANLSLIRDQISQLAILKSHISICGPSGSGRRTAAYLIHQFRHGDDLPYIDIQGHAIKTEIQLNTLFENAKEGSLLIYQAQKMPEICQLALAEKLIKQERVVEPEYKLSVISIFDDDIKKHVERGVLMPELYYVLSQGIIFMPALQERKHDIPTLFDFFLKQSCRKLSKQTPKIDASYLAALENYAWPGNVRELRNVAELYAIGIVKLAGKDLLYKESITHYSLEDQLENHEKQVIEHALFLYSGRVGDAADSLKVPRKRFYLRMKKYNIKKNDFKIN